VNANGWITPRDFEGLRAGQRGAFFAIVIEVYGIAIHGVHPHAHYGASYFDAHDRDSDAIRVMEQFANYIALERLRGRS
jgi:hypothetical protein